MDGSPETKSPSSCLKCTVLELIRTREVPDIYYLSFKPTMQNTFDFQILWFCYKDKQQWLIRTSKRFAHRLLHFGIEKKLLPKIPQLKINQTVNQKKSSWSLSISLIIILCIVLYWLPPFVIKFKQFLLITLSIECEQKLKYVQNKMHKYKV